MSELSPEVAIQEIGWKQGCLEVALHILANVGISDEERCKTVLILDKLIKELEKNGEIKVIDSDVLGREQIVLDEFLAYRQLDFDDLSFSE